MPMRVSTVSNDVPCHQSLKKKLVMTQMSMVLYGLKRKERLLTSWHLAKLLWTPDHQPYVGLPQTVATKFQAHTIASYLYVVTLQL